MAPYGVSLAAALGIALFPFKSNATCYKIDGSRADNTYEPCDPNAEFSACCATNKDRPDICLSSGLCYAQEVGYRGMIFANGCTDPKGEADECPHVCPGQANDWNGGPEIDTWNVLQCNVGGVFCCRNASKGDNCCDDSSATGTFSIGILMLPSKTGTAGRTATVTITTGRPKSTQEEPSVECPKDNTTAVVGGAVGGVLGAALLASLGVIAVMWKRRRHDGEDQWKSSNHPGVPVHELDPSPARSELQGSSAYMGMPNPQQVK